MLVKSGHVKLRDVTRCMTYGPESTVVYTLKLCWHKDWS